MDHPRSAAQAHHAIHSVIRWPDHIAIVETLERLVRVWEIHQWPEPAFAARMAMVNLSARLLLLDKDLTYFTRSQNSNVTRSVFVRGVSLCHGVFAG